MVKLVMSKAIPEFIMKNLLLIVLLILAAVMIYLGATGDMLPPALTGVGFVVIAVLLYNGSASNRRP